MSPVHRLSRSFLAAAVTIASINGCSNTQGASREHFSESDAGMGFSRIPIETGQGCDARQSIAIGAPPSVLFTTGCELYSVNTVSHEVMPRGNGGLLDEDGSTVAVIASKLGLSRDRGETFTWTDWSLVRCGGRPDLAAGGGLALVGCVAGAGRWRGDVGTPFDGLSLGSSGILPVFAAHDSQVVVNDSDGWYQSGDHGESFHPLSVSGLPG